MGVKVQTYNSALPEPGAAALDAMQGLPFDAPLQWLRTVPALTFARTVYIDQVNGDDANNGSAAFSSSNPAGTGPWRTPRRMWRDRLQYGQIRADYTVHWASGSYDVDFEMGGSDCGPGGRVLFIGETSGDIAESGTATGDVASFVIPTSAIAGSYPGTHFIEFLTGNCAGCAFQIVENTANSVTINNVTARTSNGAIANGDQFRIVTGASVNLRFMAGTAGQGVPGVNDWTGSYNDGGSLMPCHWFKNIRFGGSGGTTIRFQNSQVGFIFCRLETGTMVNARCPQLQYAAVGDTCRVPGTASNRLFGAGLIARSDALWNNLHSITDGCFSFLGSSASFSGNVTWRGGRITAFAISQIASILQGGSGTAEYRLFTGTVSVLAFGCLRFTGTTSVTRSAVTSGSCIRVNNFAVALIETNWTGSSSGAGSFGVDVRGGGRALYKSVAPQLTGVAGDLRTTSVTAANATLGADGTAAGNAADATFGETIARLAS